VNRPELVILDEPFSGLDPIAITTMAEILAETAAAGATVLFSSHQLDLVADLCEDVVVIDSGRVVLAGPLDDLRASVPERFVDVRFRGPAPDWSGVPGLDLVGAGDGRARLRVRSAADLGGVVAAAAGGIEILSVSYQPPTLSELFRRAVAA
jgi:ABC-2 type transport system ATP-binding protein